jgi:hypothetical protein
VSAVFVQEKTWLTNRNFRSLLINAAQGIGERPLALNAHSGIHVKGRTMISFVTPDNYASEPDAVLAAEKIIKTL